MAAGCTPRDGTVGVSATTTLRVCALDLNPVMGYWTDVTLDEETVTPGTGPARMSTAESSGRSFLLITPYEPFKAGSVHTLQCTYRDDADTVALTYSTTFTVATGAVYTGTTPNHFERLVIQPCTHLLDVEPLRTVLLELALVDSKYGGQQDLARAARVLYQIAQGSDAASLLNTYGPYDAEAHGTDVAGRRTRYSMLNSLKPYMRRVDAALAALVEGGPVPPALAVSLVDGYESTLYTHKLATICVMPFLARAIEDAASR